MPPKDSCSVSGPSGPTTRPMRCGSSPWPSRRPDASRAGPSGRAAAKHNRRADDFEQSPTRRASVMRAVEKVVVAGLLLVAPALLAGPHAPRHVSHAVGAPAWASEAAAERDVLLVRAHGFARVLVAPQTQVHVAHAADRLAVDAVLPSVQAPAEMPRLRRLVTRPAEPAAE